MVQINVEAPKSSRGSFTTCRFVIKNKTPERESRRTNLSTPLMLGEVDGFTNNQWLQLFDWYVGKKQFSIDEKKNEERRRKEGRKKKRKKERKKKRKKERTERRKKNEEEEEEEEEEEKRGD